MKSDVLIAKGFQESWQNQASVKKRYADRPRVMAKRCHCQFLFFVPSLCPKARCGSLSGELQIAARVTEKYFHEQIHEWIPRLEATKQV
jgi:hypothetical protein